jgi:hypothetical protein
MYSRAPSAAILGHLSKRSGDACVLPGYLIQDLWAYAAIVLPHFGPQTWMLRSSEADTNIRWLTGFQATALTVPV